MASTSGSAHIILHCWSQTLARKPLFVQLEQMSRLHPAETRRFQDLSNWDALFAAAFGIAVSEAAASQSLVSGAGQVGTGMLAAGLFVSTRLCWPMARRAWFWPLAAGMAIVDAALIAAAHWTDNWVPALALSPLTFVEVWLFTRLASAFESNERR